MYWHRPQALWVLVFIASSPGFSQPAATRTIAGIVTNAVTGEPLRRALVQLMGPPYSTFTGADGRFRFEDVPARPLQVSARRPGYSQANSVAGSGEVRLSLMPESKITGRIVGSDNEPIVGVQVCLLVSQIRQGRRVWNDWGSISTDEDGFYSAERITGGHYVVFAGGRPVQLGALNSPPEVYPPRYYPNASDFASAQVLHLDPGQNFRADMSLAPERAFRLSGTVAGIPAGVGFAPTIHDAQGQPVIFSGGQIDPATGKFEFAQVPAGSWAIEVEGNDSQGNSFRATQDFTINGSDVTGLQVVAQPAQAIPVIITHASATSGSQPQGGAQVSLVPPQSGNTYYPVPQNPPQQPLVEQSLVFANTPPGRYQLVAETFGSECLAAARSGSVDLMRDELVIAPGSQPEPITIELRNDCATLTVSVHSGSETASGFVIVAPENAGSPAKAVPFSGGGNVTLPGLSPGSYRLYAFPNIDELEYANPEALRDFRSEQIDVQPKQQASLTLQMNQLSAVQ